MSADAASSMRIRLRMEGIPQGVSEPAALVLHLAARFCSQPETFPVFLAFAKADVGELERLRSYLADLTPDVPAGIAHMVAAGVAADYADAGVTL